MKRMTSRWVLPGVIATVGCSGGSGGGGDDVPDTIPTALDRLETVAYDAVSAVAMDANRPIAYVAGEFFVEALDITDPENAVPLDASTSPIAPEDVEIAGETLFVADLTQILIYDAADPSALAAQPFLSRLDEVDGLTAAGSRLYSAEYEAGVASWDISNPLAPILLSTANTPGMATSLVLTSGFAYVGDGLEGMRVVEVGSDLTLRGALAPPAESICGTRFLGCQGATCLISQCFAFPQVVDVSNPDAPVVIGELTVDGSTTRAWMGDGYGLLARGTRLLLIDLRNPTQPAILDEVSLDDVADVDIRDLDVQGSLVGVAGDSGFALLRLEGGPF